MTLAGQHFVWRLREAKREFAETLASKLTIHPLTAQILVNREVESVEDAEKFLAPEFDQLSDPYELPDMEKAVDRLCRAIVQKERIFLHGDYDTDGVTSTAICWRALNLLEANVFGFVPSRRDGYDLQISGVDRAIAENAALILTSDCGSQAHKAIAYANDNGIEVVVTDHHRLGETLPPALAVVNPYREDVDLKFRSFCGAGVAFKLFDAVFARLKPEWRDGFRTKFVDLVALGTVADVTPLIGENRIFVTRGLEALAHSRKPGIRALIQSIDKKHQTLTVRSISHGIAPCLNAAGRIDEADLAYQLLVTKEEDKARELVQQIGELRVKVREETERVTQEALLQALMPENEKRRILVLARERWGKGVVGIAATKVMEERRRPVILLALDRDSNIYHGSARTYGGFHLLNALHTCNDILERYGGHSGAAGVSLKAENLEAFRERLELAAEEIPEEPEPPFLDVDTEIRDGRQINHELISELESLAPFGVGNPEPLFLSRNVVVTQVKLVGNDQNTLQIWCRLPGQSSAIKGVKFQGGAWAEHLEPGCWLDLVHTLKFNHYRGDTTIEFEAKDFRLVQSAPE